jgi:hypothetical protein
MVERKREWALSPEEKSIVKALLAQGWKNQDIQALVNVGRSATINSARITEVKKDNSILPADENILKEFHELQRSYDLKTRLSTKKDERLIRAREAMILAVQTFNNPSINFRTEMFSVMANIAWTYLLHEYYARHNGGEHFIYKSNGMALILSQMVKRADCPISNGMKRNIEAIIDIRNEVEHKLLRSGDRKWLSIFQACCLNFDKAICDMFGDKLSLQKELSFALQFSKLNIGQISEVQTHDIPDYIEALDARLNDRLSEDELNDIEYQFRVIYTLESSSKSRSHIHFINPRSEEAKEIHNILLKFKPSDELYPHKPVEVAKLVAERSKRIFRIDHHTKAWQKFNVRPHKGSPTPEKTKQDYCIYHKAHNDYTYSSKWIEFIVGEIKTDAGYTDLCNYKAKVISSDNISQ